MSAISIAVSAITTPVVEIVYVVVVERIANAVVVEGVVLLIKVVEIVVIEISILPFGHVPKTTIGREMRIIRIVIGMVSAKSRLVVDAAAAYIRTVGEIAAIGYAGAIKTSI